MDRTSEKIFSLIALGDRVEAAKLLQNPETPLDWALNMASAMESLGDQSSDGELALWCFEQAVTLKSSVAESLRQPAMTSHLYIKIERLKAGLH